LQKLLTVQSEAVRIDDQVLPFDKSEAPQLVEQRNNLRCLARN